MFTGAVQGERLHNCPSGDLQPGHCDQVQRQNQECEISNKCASPLFRHAMTNIVCLQVFQDKY